VSIDAPQDRPATIAEYAAILRRRIWILVVLPVLAATVAYAISSSESAQYQSHAQVSYDVSSVPGISQDLPSLPLNPSSYLATQALWARSSDLAQKVVDEAGIPGVTPAQFLAESSADAPTTGANVLNLSVSAASAASAARLADTYAEQLVDYSAKRTKNAVDAQLAQLDAQMKRFQRSGDVESARVILGRKIDLESAGNLLSKIPSVVPQDSPAVKTRPRPMRNAILGGLMGLVLALGLVFLVEALDKRVRSEQEIEEALGLPLLGRLPRPNRRLRQTNSLEMLETPTSVHAETIRKLRTSLEFVNAERKARTILVTSAGPREGKSTTIANLAVALARAGRKVALVDLDLRRPFLHCFFGVERGYGITDVVVDRIALEAAARKIALPAAGAEPPNGRRHSSNGANGRADTEAIMVLLPAGTMPPAADEFLESERLDKVLERLAGEAEIVLIDAPPLLAVGDVLTLSTKVDAMVVVTKLGIHRRQLAELARQLKSCRATILGYVLTGVSHGDSYSYGYGYDPHVYDLQPEPKPTRTRGVVASGD
jgi:polysaccharide biosynthesis transport protein